MSDVAPIISLASARDARATSDSYGRSSSAPQERWPGEGVPLVDSRLVDLLVRIESGPADGAGALVFGPASAPRGLVLTDRRKVCWATASSIRGRLKRIVENESRDLGGALRAARVVLKRYADGDEQLGVVLREHCAEAILEISRLGEEPRWAERSRHYDAPFTTSPIEVFSGLSRIARPDVSANAERALARFGRDASGVAIARSGDVHSPRLLAAVDGGCIGVRRLVSLAEWGESALPAARGLLAGAHFVMSESQAHGTSATWLSGGIRYVAWAPDGRSLTAALASDGIV